MMTLDSFSLENIIKLKISNRNIYVHVGYLKFKKTQRAVMNMDPICRDDFCYDDDVDDDASSNILSKEMIDYNDSTMERIANKTKSVPVPPGKRVVTNCLIWTAYAVKGYGRIHYNGKERQVSYVAYIDIDGLTSVPTKNTNGELQEICHLCDVSLCVEPTHLYVGTRAQNGVDRIKNGSHKGEKHYNATISEDLARKIKWSKPLAKKRKKGTHKTQDARAKEFGVSKAVVSAIDKGGSWSYLPFSDGTTSEKYAEEQNKKTKKRREEAKETEWTKEQWAEVEDIYNNPEYVRIHPTRKWFNIPCKEWLGARNGRYGVIGIHAQNVYTHVLACMIGNNYKRPEGLEASHKCGFSLCVEPKHLCFETHVDNINDKIEHGTFGVKLSP